MTGRVPYSPGTINPALLTRPSPQPGTGTLEASPFTDESTALVAARNNASTTKPSSPGARRPPRLPRISSECDLEDEILAFLLASSNDLTQTRREFDGLTGIHNPRADKRITAHRRYFKGQTEAAGELHILADPEAFGDAEIVVDAANYSIYDAYLLSADVTRNVNLFQRHRVIFNLQSRKYVFTTRKGRVGFPGQHYTMREYNDLAKARAHFQRAFCSDTGVRWEDRYKRYTDERSRATNHRYRPRVHRAKYMFIELDYRKSASGGHDPPTHHLMDNSVPVEVRGLMEDMLYGKRAVGGGTSPHPSDVFSAPRNQLSSWAIFRGFNTLKRTWEYLESGRPVQWKSILHASSLYRSLIPHPCGDSSPPLISNHHIIFLELRFLHSLWPWRGIADLLEKVYLRGSLQGEASWSLARPLYHAYSSLPHGFRRLHDTSTTEFRRLKSYLETSRQSTHYLRMELKEIYRVFIKSHAPNPYRSWIESNRSAALDWCDEERLLLWHGTPLDSLFGILDLGLQIKRKGASMTGSMFGDGIYLADVSSKAAGYCRHGRSEGEAVLLLCEADVGSIRVESTQSMSDAHEMATKGIWRGVQGLGRTGPKKWVAVDWPLVGHPLGGEVLMPDTSTLYSQTDHQSSCLAYNEYVVYNPSHVLIRYIFRLKIRHG